MRQRRIEVRRIHLPDVLKHHMGLWTRASAAGKIADSIGSAAWIIHPKDQKANAEEVCVCIGFPYSTREEREIADLELTHKTAELSATAVLGQFETLMPDPNHPSVVERFLLLLYQDKEHSLMATAPLYGLPGQRRIGDWSVRGLDNSPGLWGIRKESHP